MTRVPILQEEFLKRYNVFYNVDFPSDFMEKQDLIDTIIGKCCFRGLDYEGDGYCFPTEVLMSILADEIKNLPKMTVAYKKLKFLMPECNRRGFFELSMNINEVLKSFDSGFSSFEHQNFEDNLKATLQDLNIKTEGSQDDDDLPF